MQRTEWLFPFQAGKLAEAAAKKQAHHESRLEFWQRVKGQVMDDVRKSGIDVDEGAAGGDYLPHSNATFGPQVVVRADLQKKLTECHGKIREHSSKVREYAGWVQVLGGNDKAQLDLDADDYLYFFGE